jgi:CBS domain-containing protein
MPNDRARSEDSSVSQHLLHRLQELTVADVMTRDVAVIQGAASMQEAAAILLRAGASGAPVVNAEGRCVGVLSAVDFLRCGASSMRRTSADDDAMALPEQSPPVDRYMTTDVLSVSAQAPLTAAAETMCMRHVHRLIVTDERARPIGVISTLDVASAFLTAVDESRQQLQRSSRGPKT